MRTFQQIAALRTYLRGIREEGRSIGFVPTMGALHEGHMSLVRRARGDCDVVVVSIFVNPLQFNEASDLDAYPRDLNSDMQIASREGVDAVFMPTAEEMYPEGFQTSVDVGELTGVMEGAFRPGHFRGVATVVTKLLNITMPERAYFGQKDYQQLLVIERLVRDLSLPLSVVGIPTIREPDGLAMSSRNSRLSANERKAAPIVFAALQAAFTLALEGERSTEVVRRAMLDTLAREPLVRVEYVAVTDPDTLEPADVLSEGVSLAAIAAGIGDVRLIDNMLIAPEGVQVPKQRIVRG